MGGEGKIKLKCDRVAEAKCYVAGNECTRGCIEREDVNSSEGNTGQRLGNSLYIDDGEDGRRSPVWHLNRGSFNIIGEHKSS